ncbi:cupin domain-containing protein [Candidatus Endowatersipora endosymbiont of Watersipora subatra]|uniref:cupin domain-containing protein n=1 Tax=Candidatus Endowatersipora endosymbiont of Watersipora subatra TaxID=3077946 RepID=UPI00312CAF10
MLNNNDFVKDIGQRLKSIRKAQGLSQRKLARRAGVTNGFISQIESAKINTSISALKRVLDGIPIGISEFFSYQPESVDQIFFEGNELIEIGKGKISYKQIGTNLFRRDIQMLYEEYQPGADTGRVMLSHQGEEAGLILEGKLEVTVGDQRKILGQGDAYLFESHIPHRFRTPKNHNCIVVTACTPPSF